MNPRTQCVGSKPSTHEPGYVSLRSARVTMEGRRTSDRTAVRWVSFEADFDVVGLRDPERGGADDENREISSWLLLRGLHHQPRTTYQAAQRRDLRRRQVHRTPSTMVPSSPIRPLHFAIGGPPRRAGAEASARSSQVSLDRHRLVSLPWPWNGTSLGTRSEGHDVLQGISFDRILRASSYTSSFRSVLSA